MAKAEPESVVFIDMQDIDFDTTVTLTPVSPSREFWARTLDIALGDLAKLMAPEHVVLCEGRPTTNGIDQKAAFDAACYRQIFIGEFPDTDFISVGNSLDASQDRLEIGYTIQTLSTGTKVTRLIDRDLRSDEEVAILQAQNIRILSRRHIEAYLLDDEVIASLCRSRGQSDQIEEALAVKRSQMADRVSKGNDPDDFKSAAGQIYVELRRLLGLTGSGSTWNAFARDTLAKHLSPDLRVYQELRSDIFG
jgi:hypothetical protein